MNSTSETLYEALGLTSRATTQEIEAACLGLGEKYRPDKNPGNPEAARLFALFEEALVTLTDPAKRAAYDDSIGLREPKAEAPSSRPAGQAFSASTRSSWPLRISIVGAVLLVGLAGAWGYVTFTDYGALRFKYYQYVATQVKLDFADSYPFLSPATKNAASEEEWVKYWTKIANLQVTERFMDATITPDKKAAKIRSIIVAEGKDTHINSQSWAKVNGQWYRDYLADHPESSLFAKRHEQIRQAESEARKAATQPAKDVITAFNEFFQFVNQNTFRGVMDVASSQYQGEAKKLDEAVKRYLSNPGAINNPTFQKEIQEANNYIQMSAVGSSGAGPWLDTGMKKFTVGMTAFNSQISEMTAQEQQKQMMGRTP